jgi:hypothetical protein
VSVKHAVARSIRAASAIFMNKETIMTPIYFRHLQQDKRTIAVAAPTRLELHTALNNLKVGKSGDLPLFFGQSRVHPNDRYCKRTGRLVSSTNAKVIMATLKSALYTDTGVHYLVECQGHIVNFKRAYKKKYAQLDSVWLSPAI